MASPGPGPGDPDEQYDFLFKLVLVGDASVGKTCVVQRFKTGAFSERQGSTIGVDFTMKTLEIQGKRVKVGGLCGGALEGCPPAGGARADGSEFLADPRMLLPPPSILLAGAGLGPWGLGRVQVLRASVWRWGERSRGSRAPELRRWWDFAPQNNFSSGKQPVKPSCEAGQAGRHGVRGPGVCGWVTDGLLTSFSQKIAPRRLEEIGK